MCCSLCINTHVMDDWLVDWLIGWLIDSLIGWLIDWRIQLMTFCLPDLLTNRMADGPLDRETDRLVFKWIAQFIDCFFFLLRGSCIQTLKGHKDNVNCIHVDSTRIISVSYDQRVRVWDFNSWPQQQSLNKETIYCSKMHSFWVFLFQKIDYLILCYTSL